MSRASSKLLAGASGAAGGSPVYVDDVFQTTLYTGTLNTYPNNVVNGLDFDDKGGMLWIKNRDQADDHYLYDTARGDHKRLYPNLTNGEADQTSQVGLAFNSNGFSVGDVHQTNAGGEDFVAWNFLKQEKFFDIVTYTGNGSNGGGSGRAIAHNLGSQPGMIIVKRTDNTGDWYTANLRADGAQYHFFRLNSTASRFSNDLIANVANSTHVIVDGTSNGGGGSFANLYGGAQTINASGATYVMYLFGHNQQEFGENSDEAIIKCGSYSGNSAGSATTNQTITLGFEPQWIMIKKSTPGVGRWSIFDNMRGVVYGGSDKHLSADINNAEDSNAALRFDSTGFTLEGGNWNYTDGTTAHEYIYMAIARPHKPASEFAANKLFSLDGAGSATNPAYESNDHIVDMVIQKRLSYNSEAPLIFSRLTGNKYLRTDETTAEATGSNIAFDYMDGVVDSFSATTYSAWMFRRARGFFDVVAYTSNTTYPNTFKHNLGKVPELILIKRRDGSSAWAVYSSATGNDKHLVLNTNAGAQSSSSYWNTTTPTSTVVHVGGQDEIWGYNGYDYIAYLFASVDGISKVGSYTGTGSDLTVDCGFSAGARFVIIKRTDTSGHWYVMDTLQGITVGNDTAFQANEPNAADTREFLKPDNSGFIASDYHFTLNGATYIFLAIA